MVLTLRRAVPILVVFLVFSTLAAAAPAAIWDFNECNGTIANDVTGNGNTGTLQNGVTWTNNSYAGCAVQFDGIDDYVYVRDSPRLDITQNLTISAWIYPTAYGDRSIVSKWGGPDQRSYVLHLSNQGQVYFRVSPNGQELGFNVGTVISSNSVE